MKIKTIIYFSFFTFFITYDLYQLAFTPITNLFLPKTLFLQSETGYLFFKKKNNQLYCSNTHCGYVTNISKTGLNFINKTDFASKFFKHSEKNDTYFNQYTIAGNIASQLFTFNFKKDNRTLKISVKQDGSCYHQDKKMPFEFLIASRLISPNLVKDTKLFFNDMDKLIFKNDDSSLFVLEKQKDDVYQIVTPPPHPSKKHRFLLLLSSYKRPIYLTNQIHNFLNQNYDSNYFDFSVSIKGISRDVFHHLVLPNLSPLIDKKRLTLSYDKNKDQFTNLLNTYRNIDISNYDYLCKIDDDDFYSAHYLSTINTLIHILVNPDFLTSGSLTSLKPANDLFLKKGTTEFIGATICFSKNFAQDLLDIESKTSAQDKIYEDAFINKIATHTNKKYLYLTPLTHFIYNQTTQSIMRPNQ